MGPDYLDVSVPGQLPAQGHATAHRKISKAEGGKDMVISSTGGINGGSVLWVDRGLHHKEAECSRKLYCNATDSRPL